MVSKRDMRGMNDEGVGRIVSGKLNGFNADESGRMLTYLQVIEYITFHRQGLKW